MSSPRTNESSNVSLNDLKIQLKIISKEIDNANIEINSIIRKLPLIFRLSKTKSDENILLELWQGIVQLIEKTANQEDFDKTINQQIVVFIQEMMALHTKKPINQSTLSKTAEDLSRLQDELTTLNNKIKSKKQISEQITQLENKIQSDEIAKNTANRKKAIESLKSQVKQYRDITSEALNIGKIENDEEIEYDNKTLSELGDLHTIEDRINSLNLEDSNIDKTIAQLNTEVDGLAKSIGQTTKNIKKTALEFLMNNPDNINKMPFVKLNDLVAQGNHDITSKKNEITSLVGQIISYLQDKSINYNEIGDLKNWLSISIYSITALEKDRIALAGSNNTFYRGTTIGYNITDELMKHVRQILSLKANSNILNQISDEHLIHVRNKMTDLLQSIEDLKQLNKNNRILAKQRDLKFNERKQELHSLQTQLNALKPHSASNTIESLHNQLKTINPNDENFEKMTSSLRTSLDKLKAVNFLQSKIKEFKSLVTEGDTDNISQRYKGFITKQAVNSLELEIQKLDINDHDFATKAELLQTQLNDLISRQHKANYNYIYTKGINTLQELNSKIKMIADTIIYSNESKGAAIEQLNQLHNTITNRIDQLNGVLKELRITDKEKNDLQQLVNSFKQLINDIDTTKGDVAARTILTPSNLQAKQTVSISEEQLESTRQTIQHIPISKQLQQICKEINTKLTLDNYIALGTANVIASLINKYTALNNSNPNEQSHKEHKKIIERLKTQLNNKMEHAETLVNLAADLEEPTSLIQQLNDLKQNDMAKLQLAYTTDPKAAQHCYIVATDKIKSITDKIALAHTNLLDHINNVSALKILGLLPNDIQEKLTNQETRVAILLQSAIEQAAEAERLAARNKIIHDGTLNACHDTVSVSDALHTRSWTKIDSNYARFKDLAQFTEVFVKSGLSHTKAFSEDAFINTAKKLDAIVICDAEIKRLQDENTKSDNVKAAAFYALKAYITQNLHNTTRTLTDVINTATDMIVVEDKKGDPASSKLVDSKAQYEKGTAFSRRVDKDITGEYKAASLRDLLSWRRSVAAAVLPVLFKSTDTSVSSLKALKKINEIDLSTVQASANKKLSQ